MTEQQIARASEAPRAGARACVVVGDGMVRGRMSSEEMTRVEELAEAGLKSGQIARRLNRHQATVGWAMHRLGLKVTQHREFAYVRNGVLVKSFSREEDEIIEAMRVGGATTTKIAAALTERFGHRRSPHTVNMRLTLLANSDGDV